MKYAEWIAQEMEVRKPIDKTDVMYDETWEDYMRGREMTKEEAIDLLDNLIGMVEDNHNSNYDMALKMAIKALEQESILDKIKQAKEIMANKAHADADGEIVVDISVALNILNELVENRTESEDKK